MGEKQVKIYTFDPTKQKRVLAGEFHEGVFHRIVNNDHYVRKFKAYGLQDDVIQALKKDCKQMIIYTPVGVKLYSTVKDWLEKSVITNIGNGTQYFLPVEFMSKQPIEEKLFS